MNRMSAAAKLLFLFSLTSLIFLFSCKQPGNPAGDGEGTVSPRELYSEMLGTWIGDKDPESILVLDENECTFEFVTSGVDFKVPEDLTSLENALTGGKEMMKSFWGANPNLANSVPQMCASTVLPRGIKIFTGKYWYVLNW